MKKSEFNQLISPKNLELETWEMLSGNRSFAWDEVEQVQYYINDYFCTSFSNKDKRV